MITASEPTTAPIRGIWDEDELFARYRVTLQFTGWVIGGIPQDPKIIEGWLRQRITSGDDEIKAMMFRTMTELGMDFEEGASMEDLYEAAKKVAELRNGNTFRRDEHGLYLNAYNIKAALKENTNILYAGDRWGVTKKGPKSFLAERVHVSQDDDRIYLGRREADGIHLQVGHVTGPKGPRSTLTQYDYCDRPTITFHMQSIDDCIEPDQWKYILLSMQENGIGALRSMGYGRFKVVEFEQVSTPNWREKSRNHAKRGSAHDHDAPVRS
jgi:hypothetical protein